MKIVISEIARQYITGHVYLANNIPVISEQDALELAETVKNETKDKCKTEFEKFMLRASVAMITNDKFDFENEFENTMNQI